MAISTSFDRCQRLAPLLAAIALSGCVQADRIDDDRLVQAGFTKVQPGTAESSALPRSLPPHRFVHISVNGAEVVYYADPIACRCVYVGNADTLKKFADVEEVDVTKFDEQVSTTDYLQN
jgi:hypothetical protein